jgi:hypothetical protein
MASASVITAYLGAGTAAARPSAPTLSPGAIGVYWATDTLQWSIWDGSAWNAPGVNKTNASVTAAGSNQATALATTVDTVFVTGGAVNTGLKLKTPVVGTPQDFINTLTVAVIVYPNGATDQIENLGTTVGALLPAGGNIRFWPSSATQWWAR